MNGWYILPGVGDLRVKSIEMMRYDSVTNELALHMQSGAEHRIAVVDAVDADRVKDDIKAAS